MVEECRHLILNVTRFCQILILCQYPYWAHPRVIHFFLAELA